MSRALFLVFAMAFQSANAESWNIHTTGIIVNTNASSNSTASGGLDLDLDNDVRISVDATYFFTPHIGLNVVATTLNFDVESAGTSLGSVSVVPPIFTLQYHFSPDDPKIRPYVAAGFNYNIFYNESGTLDTLNAEVEDTIGWVVGGGADFMLTPDVSLNVDLKYLTFDADVEIGGVTADELEVDAWILGVGIGYHF
ncbi:OmpW family protein [bacterium AH-315-E07]|nr:OmpW family protein [bacterium AH-315-E07]